MSKIMVVAGGDWQIELIKKAKRMGHYVICSNLYTDSPAFKYSDANEVADVLDKDKNLQIAKKYMPDAVITDQSDIAVPTVAYVNECLGLRGIGTEKADIFTDKTLMRQRCRDTGLPAPNFKICTSVFEAEKMLKKYGKIVIKPIDSQSSRGVYTITDFEELEKRFEEAMAYSNRRKEVLAEEYIGGDEFTIDGLVVDGVHYPLCISIKEMYKENPNISKVQTYTYSHPQYDYEQLRRVNKSLIESIGLPFGLTHSEYKFWNGQYYLIEAGARGGGSNLSAKIVPFMSGIDNYEFLIKQALGEPTDTGILENYQLPQNKCAVMRFFDFGEGIVKQVEGIDYIKNAPGIIDYQLEIKPGDKLEQPKYGRLRPGHFIVGGETYNEAQSFAKDILEKVHIKFEE